MKTSQPSLKVVWCLSVVLYAQTLNAESLSFLDAYQKSLTFDATVLAAQNQYEAQKEEINKANAGFLPQIRISGVRGFAYTDSTSGNAYGQAIQRHSLYQTENYSLQVRQPIFNKSTFAASDQAEAKVKQGEWALSAERLNLISRLTQAYLDLLNTVENIRYVTAQKKSVQQQLELAERRFKSELGTVTEIHEAKTNLEQVIAEELGWNDHLDYAKHVLENFIGEYPKQFFLLDPNKLKLDSLESKTLSEWLDVATQHNPKLHAAEYNLEVAEHEIEKDKGGHYPTVDLVGQKVYSSSDNTFTVGNIYDTNSVNIQVNVPIYLGGYVSATVRQAEAQFAQARNLLDDVKRDLNVSVHNLYNELQKGALRIKAYEQAVKSAEIALVGTTNGYQAGFRTNVEVLNAETRLYDARRLLSKERYTFVNNRIQLKLSAGTLSASDVEEVNSWLTIPSSLEDNS